MVESGFQIGGGGPRAYDHSVAEFAGPFADVAVSAVHPKPGESLLDLACGTGFVTRRAAYSVGARRQRRRARHQSGHAGSRRRRGSDIADWVCASADDMPFADASFDAIVCQQGVQFFPDPVAALVEARRVLRPAGRICATVWAAPTFSPYFHAVATGLIAAIGDAGVTPLYAAMPEAGDELLRGWAEAAGLSDIAVRQVEVVINLPADPGVPAEPVAGHAMGGAGAGRRAARLGRRHPQGIRRAEAARALGRVGRACRSAPGC